LIEGWEHQYAPAAAAALAANPKATAELLRITQAPTDPLDATTTEETALGLLWSNVFATQDAVAKLGGQPFDNHIRWYYGSSKDLQLNRKVERYRADTAALAEIKAHYQTSGVLSSPLVTLHTTGDPVVPYWHVPLYALKTFAAGSASKHTHIPILRYGHCNFKASEVLAGFALLVYQTSGVPLQNISAVLPDANAQAEFQQLMAEYGAAP
jgi:hypothetical protein